MPIGLDIHAETPDEIAISILAEIIARKTHRKINLQPEGAFMWKIIALLKQRELTQQLAHISIPHHCRRDGPHG